MIAFTSGMAVCFTIPGALYDAALVLHLSLVVFGSTIIFHHPFLSSICILLSLSSEIDNSSVSIFGFFLGIIMAIVALAVEKGMMEREI